MRNEERHLLDWASFVGEVLGALALALMVCHIGLDVALQAFAGSPLRGTNEIVSQIYMPFVVFGALATVQRRGEEIRVDLIETIVPRAVSRALDRFAQLLVIVAALFLAWHTGHEALRAIALGERIELGTTAAISWPGKLILPVGFVLLALAAFLRAVRR
jgi:TRAP-type C4-dicarboxylate transport system permease small subunit